MTFSTFVSFMMILSLEISFVISGLVGLTLSLLVLYSKSKENDRRLEKNWGEAWDVAKNFPSDDSYLPDDIREVDRSFRRMETRYSGRWRKCNYYGFRIEKEDRLYYEVIVSQNPNGLEDVFHLIEAKPIPEDEAKNLVEPDILKQYDDCLSFDGDAVYY